MFGLIYTAINAIAYIVSGTKMTIEDYQSKEDAIRKQAEGKNREGLYTDHQGITRDILTNKKRYVSPDYKTGDVWITGLHGEKYRNLSKEKRDEEFNINKLNNPNCKAVKYTTWGKKSSQVRQNSNVLVGDIYKDVNNGDLYVKRDIRWFKSDLSPVSLADMDKYNNDTKYVAGFYMRTADATLVGLYDGKQPEHYNSISPDEDEVKRFIESFNAKQREKGWWRYWKQIDSNLMEFDHKYLMR